MGQTNQPEDLASRIRRLERELGELRRRTPASSAWLPIAFQPPDATPPADTTTSATFVDLQSAVWLPQHPRLRVRVLARASDGTTSGEIRVLVGGSPLAPEQTVPFGFFGAFEFGPATLPVPYTHQQATSIVVQGRRTFGAGTIGARVAAAYGTH